MIYLLVFLVWVAFSLAGPKIVVEDAWVRDVPPVARTTAVFMKIRNLGDEEDTLLKVISPVAERAEIHETIAEEGVMKMRPVDRLAIPPGSTVYLRPMGKHIMLMGLKDTLNRVGKVRLVLIFEKSGRIVVEAPVRKADRR
ncbi:MAG: copper chaperone PCu(A)C [Aquificota bacterium]|nr:copper chaperone PCu(A)C [Aquificota bacterium]